MFLKRPTAAVSLLIVVFLFYCKKEEGPDLIGHWQAFEITEEGEPLQVDPREIQFEFQADGIYYFQSTLNYREAGRYRLSNREYLFTTDTLESGAAEKAVEISRLTADSLTLRMNDAGKERLLKLEKIP